MMNWQPLMNNIYGVSVVQETYISFFFLSRGVFNKQGYQCQGKFELISNDVGEIVLILILQKITLFLVVHSEWEGSISSI